MFVHQRVAHWGAKLHFSELEILTTHHRFSRAVSASALRHLPAAGMYLGQASHALPPRGFFSAHFTVRFFQDSPMVMGQNLRFGNPDISTDRMTHFYTFLYISIYVLVNHPKFCW